VLGAVPVVAGMTGLVVGDTVVVGAEVDVEVVSTGS